MYGNILFFIYLYHKIVTWSRGRRVSVYLVVSAYPGPRVVCIASPLPQRGLYIRKRNISDRTASDLSAPHKSPAWRIHTDKLGIVKAVFTTRSLWRPSNMLANKERKIALLIRECFLSLCAAVFILKHFTECYGRIFFVHNALSCTCHII